MAATRHPDDDYETPVFLDEDDPRLTRIQGRSARAPETDWCSCFADESALTPPGTVQADSSPGSAPGKYPDGPSGSRSAHQRWHVPGSALAWARAAAVGVAAAVVVGALSLAGGPPASSSGGGAVEPLAPASLNEMLPPVTGPQAAVIPGAQVIPRTVLPELDTFPRQGSRPPAPAVQAAVRPTERIPLVRAGAPAPAAASPQRVPRTLAAFRSSLLLDTPTAARLDRLPALDVSVLPSVPAATEAAVSRWVSGPASEPARGDSTAETSAPADAEAVRQTVRSYREAYERLDVDAAARVWPTVDRRALARAFDALESQGLDFRSCAMTVLDRHATAHCRGILRFVRRVGKAVPLTAEQQWVFRLRRAGTGWSIEDVQAFQESSPAEEPARDQTGDQR